MDVAIETVAGLVRKMTVTMPPEKFVEEENACLQDFIAHAKIDGFRAGKVPPAVVKKRFADSIRKEVVDKLISSSLPVALKEKNVHLVSRPTVESIDAEPGQPFKYAVTFEVEPEFEVKDLAGVELEQTEVEVTEQDITNMLEKVRAQFSPWEVTERAAKTGDVVVIDFKGMIENVPFEGGTAQNYRLELGSGRFIPGFEEGLIGAKPGSEVELKLTFPADYKEDLAGKEVVFLVTVHKIEEKRLLPIDDELAEKFGIKEGGLAKMKQEIASQLKRMVESKLSEINKNVVISKLAELNVIEVPSALVEEEIAHLQQVNHRQMAQYLNKNPKELATLPKELFTEMAKKNVSLRFVFQELMKKHKLELDQAKVDSFLQQLADAYEQPDEIIQMYKKDQKKLSQIQSRVFEDQLIDKLISEAKVTKKTLSCDELLNDAKAA